MIIVFLNRAVRIEVGSRSDASWLTDVRAAELRGSLVYLSFRSRFYSSRSRLPEETGVFKRFSEGYSPVSSTDPHSAFKPSSQYNFPTSGFVLFWLTLNC